MKKVSVRRVNEWDSPSMLKMLECYMRDELRQDENIPELKNFISLVEKYTYGMGWIICEIDSESAGFCYITENPDKPEDPFSVDIHILVGKKFRRKGVGTALYSLMSDIMQLGNRRDVTVRISPYSISAAAFFKALGFAAEKSPQDTLKMSRLLSPADPYAEKAVKPYLIENADYEEARERAAGLVRQA